MTNSIRTKVAESDEDKQAF
jgi:hypothetical protein